MGRRAVCRVQSLVCGLLTADCSKQCARSGAHEPAAREGARAARSVRGRACALRAWSNARLPRGRPARTRLCECAAGWPASSQRTPKLRARSARNGRGRGAGHRRCCRGRRRGPIHLGQREDAGAAEVGHNEEIRGTGGRGLRETAVVAAVVAVAVVVAVEWIGRNERIEFG